MAKETKTKIVNVTNAYGDKNTTAQILVQNKIKYTPKVSVIIPVYNTELYLRQCMDSVVNQTLREIEIICVDDGSTDTSYSICDKYKELEFNSFLKNIPDTSIKVTKDDYGDPAIWFYLY